MRWFLPRGNIECGVCSKGKIDGVFCRCQLVVNYAFSTTTFVSLFEIDTGFWWDSDLALAIVNL